VTAAAEASALVEWLAALWQATDDGSTRCANPHLLPLLRVAAALQAHPAREAVARARAVHGRDRLVKALVGSSYGQGRDGDGLFQALRPLLTEGARALGAGSHAVVEEARALAAQRLYEIASDLDPAADLAELVGERVALSVVVAPSVFLPPPQAGRHGVLVRGAHGSIAHLHFGLPLRQDPRLYSITRPWLAGGGWHYAIQLYLERRWPDVATRLTSRPALAEGLSAALRSPDGDGTGWTDLLQVHLNVALKCLLSRRLNMPDGIHRAFARARGLVLFPWFEEWMLGASASGGGLAAAIAALPDALADGRARWEALAAADGGPPPAVNLALISRSARGACLVVPDAWPEQAVQQAVAGWRLLPLPLLRYSEWAGRADRATRPAIAFGEPASNPLVRAVLEQRGLSLDRLAAEDPAIIALSAPAFTDAPWCVAVAVSRPQTAAGLRMEMALRQTSSYVALDGTLVIAAERVSLDGAPAPALSAQ
jgi:hypothetical protein